MAVAVAVGVKVAVAVAVAVGVGDAVAVAVGLGEGSGVGETLPGSVLKLPMRNRQPAGLVIGTYWFTYQKVRSSVGSTERAV